MAGTQTSSIRSTTVIEGSNIYVIVTTCVVPGTLTDSGIFLLSIVTPEDPKDDSLLRVITVADISEFKTDRDAAILAGESSWRAAAVTLQFNDIETANAAWKELESRVNTLVGQVDAFNDEFETAGVGDITVYPTADLSEITARITAYEATADPITLTEDARDSKQRSCSQFEADIVVVEQRLQEAESDLTTYLQIQADVGNVNTALPSISAVIATANTQARVETDTSAASALEKTSINVQHNLIDTQITALTAQAAALNTVQTGAISAAVAALQARVITLTTQKSSVSTSINACAVALATLEAAVDAARADRETALADVLAVCPTFTP